MLPLTFFSFCCWTTWAFLGAMILPLQRKKKINVKFQILFIIFLYLVHCRWDKQVGQTNRDISKCNNTKTRTKKTS